MTARLTVAQARSEIIKRLGASDDGQSSPELLAQITSQIGSQQRALCLEFRNLLPRRIQTQTLVSGRQWYPLPCAAEGISSVTAVPTGGCAMKLVYGMTVADYLDTTVSIPQIYDIRPTIGVVQVNGLGGTGYVNGSALTFSAPGGSGTTAAGLVGASTSPGPITSITITDPGSEYVVAPTVTAPTGSGATLTAVLGTVDALFLKSPSVAGTITIEYRDFGKTIVADTDALVFDSEMVICMVAALMVTGVATPLAQSLTAAASNYRAKLDNRMPMRPAASGFALTPNSSRTGTGT